MADLSEVEETFVTIIRDALGMGSGYQKYSVGASTIPVATPVRLYRGWPLDTQLRNDLKVNVTNISIFSAPELAMDTTCHLRRMTEVVTQFYTPTMTATLHGTDVTFAGTATVNECIGVAKFTAGYAYRLSANDTPDSVAAAFAANIPGASAAGPVLSLNTLEKVTVTYGADVVTLTELHRQEQIVRVSVWTPTTELRDQLCATIDPAIMWLDRITFAENSISGPIRNAGTHVDDNVGLEFMWRRDLMYKIDYATTYKQIEPPFVLGELTPIEKYV